MIVKKPWTAEEIEFLTNNYRIIPNIHLQMNRSQQAVSYKAWELKLTGHMSKGRIQFNAFYFDIWSPNMAYILGIIAADGNLFKVKNKESYRITVTQADKTLLEWIANELEFEGKIKETIVQNTADKVGTCVVSNKTHFIRYDLIFSSKYVFDRLVELGLDTAKSLTMGKLKIPTEYFKYFIRGYIDGDGSVSYYKDKRKKHDYYSLEISMLGSYNFLKWVQSHLHNHANLPKQKPYEKTGSRIKQLRYRGTNAVKLGLWIYDENKFGIERKHETLKNYLKLDSGAGLNTDTVTRHATDNISVDDIVQ